MKRLSTGSRERPGVMLAPLVDMLFVLLIFVLLVSTVNPSALPVELPGAATETAPEAALQVTLAEDGSLHFRGERMTVEAVAAELQLMDAERKQRGLTVAADRSVPVERVVAVIQAARSVGIEQVELMTQGGGETGGGGAGGSP